MTESDALATQQALVEAALRLVDHHPDIAAGSVLRCFSRAVRLMRRAGTPSRDLVARSESLAARMLAARTRRGRRELPQQRRIAALGVKTLAVPA